MNPLKIAKRLFPIIIGLSFILCAGPVLAQGTWATKTSMPTSRWASTVGAINGKIIVAGGYNGIHITTVETYDTLANTWATKSSRPTPQTSAANGVISGVLYAAGGTDCCVEISDLWAYDPTGDTWTLKAALPEKLQGAGGGVINGQLHVVGGKAFGQALTSHHVYDPVANTWTLKAPMPTARSFMGVGVVNGILYAVGGFASDGASVFDTVEAYDPLTNAWTAKASMPTARGGLRVEVVNGILYAVGGILSTVEAYDPFTNTWTTAASMPTARSYLGVGVVNGVLYAIGGVGASGAPPGLTTNEAFNTVLPFTFFTAKFKLVLGPLTNDDEFNMNATFTLGAGSDDIAPLTENVTVQIGTFSWTIPAGSFKLVTPKKKPGFFTFAGPIDQGTLHVNITPLGEDNYVFKARGTGLNLAVATPPITVGVIIGDDGGSGTQQ